MRKDPTEFRERFKKWQSGEKVYEAGLPKYEDGYESFLATLPDNQKKPGAYNTRRYWELNGKPKNFAEAIGQGMYTFENDNAWHANSVAYNDKNDTYEFMKPNYHETRWMELVYGYDKDPEFLKEWKVKYNGPMLSDRYVRREKPGLKVKGGQLPHFDKGGKMNDKIVDGGTLREVVVTGRNYESLAKQERNRQRNIAKSYLKSTPTISNIYNAAGAMWKETGEYELPRFEGGEEKFKLKKTPEFVQAGKDNSWSKVANDDMGEVFQNVVARPNRTGGNTSAGSWKKLWEPKYEKPLEIVSPEFDVISSIRGILQILKPIRAQKAVDLRKNLSHRNPAYKVTEENAASMTPEQWTVAQDAAIARGDMSEAQRLRDLHFKVNAPSTQIVDKNGSPLHTYHGGQKGITTFLNPNEFDASIKLNNYYKGGRNRIGIYTSDWKSYAEQYARGYKKKDRDIYDLYVNMENPKYVSYLEYLLNRLRNLNPFRKKDYLNPSVIRPEHKEQLLRGYDGVKWDIENVVFDGKQLKSADAITYDANGARIPLGERDNFNINDIRYGIIPLISGSTGYGLYNKYAE